MHYLGNHGNTNYFCFEGPPMQLDFLISEHVQQTYGGYVPIATLIALPEVGKIPFYYSKPEPVPIPPPPPPTPMNQNAAVFIPKSQRESADRIIKKMKDMKKKKKKKPRKYWKPKLEAINENIVVATYLNIWKKFITMQKIKTWARSILLLNKVVNHISDRIDKRKRIIRGCATKWLLYRRRRFYLRGFWNRSRPKKRRIGKKLKKRIVRNCFKEWINSKQIRINALLRRVIRKWRFKTHRSISTWLKVQIKTVAFTTDLLVDLLPRSKGIELKLLTHNMINLPLELNIEDLLRLLHSKQIQISLLYESINWDRYENDNKIHSKVIDQIVSQFKAFVLSTRRYVDNIALKVKFFLCLSGCRSNLMLTSINNSITHHDIVKWMGYNYNFSYWYATFIPYKHIRKEVLQFKYCINSEQWASIANQKMAFLSDLLSNFIENCFSMYFSTGLSHSTKLVDLYAKLVYEFKVNKHINNIKRTL